MSEKDRRRAPETFDDRGPSPWPDGDGPRAGTAPRSRARRVLFLLVVLVLAGAGIVRLIDRTPPSADRAAPPSAGTPGGPTAGSATADVFGQPTRGSLAGDAAFLDAVRRLAWPSSANHDPVPPQASRRVAFAGDVPGGRWALVVAPQGDGVAAAWFTGPTRATADQLTGQLIGQRLSAGTPAALVAPRTGALVVVAAAGDVVSVSERPDIAADGRVSRAYRTIGAPRGVAVAALTPSDFPTSTATTVRVIRHGVPLADVDAELLADPTDAPPVAIHYLRGTPPLSGQQTAEAAAEQVLGQLGLAARDVDVTGLWVGFVPRPGGLSGATAIVAVTVPSGAVVVDAEWLLLVQSADYFVRGRCGQGIEPAGPPVSARVTAVTCGFQSGTGAPTAGGSLVVVGPPEVTRVRTYTGGGTTLDEYPAASGVAVAPLPLGVDTVEGITARGVGLGRARLLGSAADFGN